MYWLYFFLFKEKEKKRVSLKQLSNISDQHTLSTSTNGTCNCNDGSNHVRVGEDTWICNTKKGTIFNWKIWTRIKNLKATHTVHLESKLWWGTMWSQLIKFSVFNTQKHINLVHISQKHVQLSCKVLQLEINQNSYISIGINGIIPVTVMHLPVIFPAWSVSLSDGITMTFIVYLLWLSTEVKFLNEKRHRWSKLCIFLLKMKPYTFNYHLWTANVVM